MLKKIIKDYFSFSKKERIAVTVLVIMVICISLLPYWFPDPGQEAVFTELEKSRLQFDSLYQQNENGRKPAPATENRQLPGYAYTYRSSSTEKRKAALFFFDPNTLAVEGWAKLGLSGRTISTIQNYLSKGGKFRTGTDLKRIYGLHPDEADRLIPFVRISGTEPGIKTVRSFAVDSARYRTGYRASDKIKPVFALTDINTADSISLIALPGIGTKLAGRILHFREKLGGFYSVDQVSEIYGLPDSTFQKIKPLLTLQTVAMPFLNINTVEAQDLLKHPYFKGPVALAIVEYRRQHGEYKSVEDLHKIALVNEALFNRMAPYCKVE